MGNGPRSDLELELELDELYRNVSGEGASQGGASPEGKPPGRPAAARRRRLRRAVLAGAGLLAAGALLGLAALAWHADGDDEAGLGRVILRITGLKGEGESYLVDKEGRRYRVPTGAVILPLEAGPSPPALPPAGPPASPLAQGSPVAGAGGVVQSAETAISSPAPPALSDQESAAPAVTGEGAYAVQIRAYPEDRKAEALTFAQELRRSGEVVTVETVKLPGRGVWHRVLVGGFATADEAADYRQERLAGRFPLSFVQRRAYFSQRAW